MKAITKRPEPASLTQHRLTPHCNYDNYGPKDDLRHALVIEHQLRPLFSFFGAKTLATGVFITDKSISNGWVEEAAVSARLDQLIAEAVHELKQTKPAKAFASG